jgi:hypothetical protein
MMSIEPAAMVDTAATARRPIIWIISVRMHLGALSECKSDKADQE